MLNPDENQAATSQPVPDWLSYWWDDPLEFAEVAEVTEDAEATHG